MKNTPIVLTLLCTSLVWCSASNAMEDDRLVLDRKVGEDGRNKILVLTEVGLAKAKSLEEFYNQQGESFALSESMKSSEKEKYQRDLNRALEESELAEAIRLSLEGQPSETNSSHGPLENKLQVLKPSDLSLPIVEQEDDSQLKKVLLESAQEEDDSQLKKALLESTQEYEAHREKIAAERTQAQERRNEAIKELKEAREIREIYLQSLHSRRDELKAKETALKEKNLTDKSKLVEDELRELSDMIITLTTEIETFNPLWKEIHEEIMHLLHEGDPRDLPWKQGLFLTRQGGASSLPSSSLDPQSSIPSSVLPNLNGDPSKDSGKNSGSGYTFL